MDKNHMQEQSRKKEIGEANTYDQTSKKNFKG
jgi:hypothetical protein